MNARFSTGDVAEIMGMPMRAFHNWCERNHFESAAGGDGQGNHRRFTLMQVVGLRVGFAVREETGCVVPYMCRIVEAFGGMTEDELLRELKRQGTHFVTVHEGRVILRGKKPYWIDVRALYEDTLEKAAEIGQRLRLGVGRRRGLEAIVR